MSKVVTPISRKQNKPLSLKQITTIQQNKPKVIPNNGQNIKFEPVVNIITRTSNRPVGFSVCRESVKKQTYKKIRHIVSYDNLNDKTYVDESGAEAYFIDKTLVEKQPDIPDPKTGKKFVYNLYFDTLFKIVTEGYILILDDDDRLTDEKSIEKMVAALDESVDMVIHQMKYPNNTVLPTIMEMEKIPRIGRIGSPCVLVKADIAKKIKWDGWKCGDFRYISKAFQQAKNVKWIKDILISLGNTGGHGNRIDIEKNDDPIVESKKVMAVGVNGWVERGESTKKAEEVKQETATDNKKISFDIICVGWNCEKFVKETYNSIKKQVVGNYDYTIHLLDDGSTDKTWNIISDIAIKDPKVVTYRNNKNNGAAYSRYKIIQALKNPESICLMLDMDDQIYPNTLNELVNVYSKNPNCYVTFSNFKQSSDNLEIKPAIYTRAQIDTFNIEKEGFKCPPLRTFKTFLAKNSDTSLMKDDDGIWIKYCTDVALMLGILAQCNGDNVVKIEKTLYLYNNKRTDGTQKRFSGKKRAKFKEILTKVVKLKKDGVIKLYNNG